MNGLQLSHEQQHALLQHARAAYPNEACGLIAGQGGRAALLLPVLNASPTPRTAYRMAAPELLQALKRIDAAGLTLIAIYHSHPSTDAVPSLIDVQSAGAYPDVMQLIISLKPTPQMAAWRIQDGLSLPVDICIGAGPALTSPRLSRLHQIATVLATLISLLVLLSVSLSLLPPAPVIPAPR